jgi:formylglycine-generating enzyme required for sulfatase activity
MAEARWSFRSSNDDETKMRIGALPTRGFLLAMRRCQHDISLDGRLKGRLPPRPRNRVHTEWMIGKTPVTNAEYREFVKASGGDEPVGEHFKGSGKAARWCGPFQPWKEQEFSSPDQPVRCTDLRDAHAYAGWLQRFTRNSEISLTATEVWDFAALGVPHPSYDTARRLTGKIHDNSKAPAIVSMVAERANRFGVVDLFGNVWEWTREDEAQGLSYAR